MVHGTRADGNPVESAEARSVGSDQVKGFTAPVHDVRSNSGVHGGELQAVLGGQSQEIEICELARANPIQR